MNNEDLTIWEVLEIGKTPFKMFLCPRCKGKHTSTGFVSRSHHHAAGDVEIHETSCGFGTITIDCEVCENTGAVLAETLISYRIGQAMKRARVAEKEMTTREQAQSLGLTFREWLAVERGDFSILQKLKK